LRRGMSYAVEMREVSTYYFGEKKPAIIDVTLTIPINSLTLIVGPNGAGKTTLLETILGLLEPRRGIIRVLGHDIPREAAKIRRLCSYLPQDFMKPQGEPFSVKDVVAMGIASNREFGKLRSEDWELVEEALTMLGIAELADRPIGRLSGGQQQKVMLARALVRKPKLLLLDEPFSALDEDSRRFISTSLLPKLIDSGCTVIMVSHDASFTPPRCDLTIRMEEGRIVEVVSHDLRSST